MEKKTRTFLCDKIVRDNDPALFAERGIHAKTRMLKPEEIATYLKKKLLEEVREACEGKPEEVVNELADVYEAAKALLKVLDISEEYFSQIKHAKRERKGGFENFVCLESVTMPEDHPEVGHYLAEPEKYPEVL